MLEALFVASIVLVAAGYAFWALLPGMTRRNLALRGVVALGGPQAPGLAGRLSALLQKLASRPGSGCGDCPAAGPTPAERAARNGKPR